MEKNYVVMTDSSADLNPALEQELHLTEHALSVLVNPGKDNRISSYAVCVYEPDLVEGVAALIEKYD